MEQKTSAMDLMANPRFKKFISAFAELSKASEKLSLDEGRRLSSQFFLPTDTIYEPIEKIENIEIPGKDKNKISIRIFNPDITKKLPTMIYFHRGGFVFGSVDEADPVCRKLANHLKCIVASVEYRLAPEYPFPKPLEDCYAATEWISKNIGNYGGDTNQLMVSGESAGCNLAAAVSLMARDNNGPKLTAQILINPVITATINDKAYEDSVDRYFITKDAMKFFWSMYLQSPEEKYNPYASPDQAKNFTGLPPALIITAEYDPLCKEAKEYGDKLRHDGVNVIYHCFPKVIHSFIDLPIYDEDQKITWIKEIGDLLKKLNRQ